MMITAAHSFVSNLEQLNEIAEERRSKKLREIDIINIYAVAYPMLTLAKIIEIKQIFYPQQFMNR